MLHLNDLTKGLQAYDADMDDEMKDRVRQLQQVMQAEPTASQLANVVACIMATEIVVAPSPGISAQIQQFYKYVASSLKVLKKDSPSKPTDKLDRMIKELPASV